MKKELEYFSIDGAVGGSQGWLKNSYLRPRVMGIKKTEWFIEGFEQYLTDVSKKNERKLRLILTSVSGMENVSEAVTAIKTQIDAGYPVPYLLLHHQNKELLKDFEWHWFMVIGYEETDTDFLVKVATYGNTYQFSLSELWNTGHEERGGMVLVRYQK